ncbi:MAG: biogenesis of lysosome-related organelles complex 1 subunit 2 [Luminiphilus sp.]|nr:biogenesis of lysosome-related organelles complex 1 subunit 2 [Luminiphilus sp.]
MPKNQNVWNYVPPHRGARLDGGTPGSLNNDNSVDGGWSDRSTLGSSTSGHVYVEEAPFTGDSFIRRDGEWKPLFEGAGAIDSFLALIEQVQQIDARLSALEATVSELELSAEGWQEARIASIETTQQSILDGTVTLEKVLAKNNITAYVDTP